MRKISLPDYGKGVGAGKWVEGRGGGRTYCNLDDNWNGKENEWNVLNMMRMRLTKATTRLTLFSPQCCMLQCCRCSSPSPAPSVSNVLPSLSLSTRLSSCRSVFPCCLFLLRLFALKILFIAIARICTKISYNAGQQHRDGKRIMK